MVVAVVVKTPKKRGNQRNRRVIKSSDIRLAIPSRFSGRNTATYNLRQTPMESGRGRTRLKGYFNMIELNKYG